MNSKTIRCLNRRNARDGFRFRFRHFLPMGNTNGQITKIGKTLTDENVVELSKLSGFTSEQVRDWHTGFLVSHLALFSSTINR